MVTHGPRAPGAYYLLITAHYSLLRPCVTKTTPLIGSEDFESNLNIKLIQA